MKMKENRCCDCANEFYPCRGSECGLRHYTAYYCDICDKEIREEDLIEQDGYHYHSECLEREE